MRFVLIALCLAGCASAPPQAASPNADFYRWTLAEAGFRLDPTDKAEVRWLLLHDTAGALWRNGVELRREGDRVQVTVLGPEAPPGPVTVDPKVWDRLSRLEAAAFTVAAPPSGPSRTGPPPACHGWISFLGRPKGNTVETAAWAECSGSETGFAYSESFAQIAVEAYGCGRPGERPFTAYLRCFNPKRAGR